MGLERAARGASNQNSPSEPLGPSPLWPSCNPESWSGKGDRPRCWPRPVSLAGNPGQRQEGGSRPPRDGECNVAAGGGRGELRITARLPSPHLHPRQVAFLGIPTSALSHQLRLPPSHRRSRWWCLPGPRGALCPSQLNHVYL